MQGLPHILPATLSILNRIADMANKTPVRHCMGCNGGFDKFSLIRIVRIDNKVVFDPTKKAQGRGAYLCKNPDCLKRVIKSRRFNRVFKAPIDESIYEILATEIERE